VFVKVRGIDFNRNLLVVASTLILCISDYLRYVNNVNLLVEFRALVVEVCLGMLICL